MADGFSIQVEGLDSWILWNREQIGLVDRAIQKAMNRLTEDLEREIQANIRSKFNNPEELASAVEVAILRVTDVEWEGEVTVAAEYAVIQEYGGTIEAKQGYLVFPSSDSNEFVYAEQVVIPARPYVGPAVNAFRDRVDRYILEELHAVGFLA